MPEIVVHPIWSARP